ncbi:MAG: right-handed parallel beta-helix repeat-containing protein [Candidatus Thorarchaeota archaeon]|jgi:parallel beta-helix repeat protein
MRGRAVSFALTAILILSSFSLVVTILPENASALTRYVGGSGPGNYTTIQEGVDAAIPGDTVFVFAGTYQEDVEIPIPLSLVGEDPNTTMIDIPGSGSNILVTSDWVNITGFSITKVLPGGNNWGISLDNAHHCSISHNIIFRNTLEGIFAANSDHTVISDNLILENRGGMTLGMSHSNIITNNTFHNTGENVKLSNSQFNIVSYNTGTSDAPFYGGVNLWGADNNTLLGNNFTQMGTGVGLYKSNNNTIISNLISYHVVGIWLEISKYNVLRNNAMVENGVYFKWGDLAHWNNNIIDTSNTVNGKPVYYWKNVTGGTIPSGAGQVILANCTNVVVENQNITNATEGVTLGYSFNNTIRNNNASSHHYNGFRSYESGYNLVEFNVAFNNRNGILFEQSANTSVSNNTVLHNQDGISLYDARENTLIQNKARFNDNGIFTYGAIFNWITNNTISNNSAGISFDGSTSNMINHNTISNNSAGISFDASISNIIRSNTISTNSVGVYLTHTDNLVYHNSFINNTEQAVDSGFFGFNQWDNGYPSGGNYWSDYTGIDVKMGPRQDNPGKDGIGDTPYNFQVNSRDRYPLLYSMEFARHRPPIMKYAILSGTGHRDVVVGWDLSPDDGSGLNSIVGYDLYRNTSYDPFYSGYQLLTSLPSGSIQFVDSQAGEGDPVNYFYLVCAVNVTGTSSCSTEQAGKFTRAVGKGLNLLSFPLIQSDESVETVLQTLEFNRVWTYDSATGDWRSYDVSKPHKGSLRMMNHRIGFWTSVTQDSNLTVAGIVPLNTMVQLKTGWNLVGFPSFRTMYTVSDLKAGTGATEVEGLDALSPPYFLKELASWETLQAGFGYWVRMENDRVWAIDNG